MTVILRVALLTALTTASIPAVAPAQGTAIDSLNRRVVLLEGKVADWKQRVRMLETLVKADSSLDRSAPARTTSGDLANWRRLSRGMTMSTVRGLLGEPKSVATLPTFTMWQYPDGGSVNFSSDDKVQGWMEP